MHHTKDCIVNAEHAALRDITRPITDHYRGEGWTTALAIVRERMEKSKEQVNEALGTGIWFEYRRGRYEMARDILAEMEERGKP